MEIDLQPVSAEALGKTVPSWNELALAIQHSAELAPDLWSERHEIGENRDEDLSKAVFPPLLAYPRLIEDLFAVDQLVQRKLQHPTSKLARSMLEASLQLYHYAICNDDEREALFAGIVIEGLKRDRNNFKKAHAIESHDFGFASGFYRRIRERERQIQSRVDRKAVTPKNMMTTLDLLDRYGTDFETLLWWESSGLTHALGAGSFSTVERLGAVSTGPDQVDVTLRPWNELRVRSVLASTLSPSNAPRRQSKSCSTGVRRGFSTWCTHLRSASGQGWRPSCKGAAGNGP